MLTLFMLAETCRLLIIFANSLDPDQDQHSVGSDLDVCCSSEHLKIFAETADKNSK